jgi:hypothetical protein
LRKKPDKASRSGTFTLGPGRELYGELTLAGPRTFLYLDDKDKFAIDSLPDRHITGVLRDRTEVSLLKCIPQRYSSGDRSGEAHYSAEIFPHFVVVGDHHVHPNDRTISAVHFRVDDGSVLFWDFDATGWLLDARPLAEQVANANAGVTGRRVAIGPDPEIFYFSGKEEIVTASTAFGTVSVQQHLQRNFFSRDGKARLRIEISIEFEPAVNFDEAIFRMTRIVEYLGMLVGRPQNVLDCWVRNKPEPEEPPLRVHWSMPLRRDKESESPRPSNFDILMNAAVQPEEFKRVLEGWVARQKEWHGARWRFFNSFRRQRLYDIDRLIGSANMFDILPDSALPSDTPVSEELGYAQATARGLFRNLPRSAERDSVLGTLGRLGKHSLKRKARHRAARIVEAAREWFPDLLTVVDEGVNCRNYYVHGGEPRFDYDRNFDAVTFCTNTLEFVFAASDLIEAGWDIRSWITHGTTMTHPFGQYRVAYSPALKQLKALLPATN